MGSGRRRTPPRRGVTRRAFIRRLGLGSAALASPLLPGCGSSALPAGQGTAIGAGTTPGTGTGTGAAGGTGTGTITAPVGSFKASFVHGVASGDPLADRVILWTRLTGLATGSTPVDYVVATDTALTKVVARGTFVTDQTRDYTVKPDVTGLSPATTYYYQFASGAVLSPVGRTKTLPTADADIQRLRVAAVVCSSYPHGFFNAYRFVSQRQDLDFFLHLGDYIYEYAQGAYGTVRAVSEPATEVVSLADYRARHAQYKKDTDTQALHKQHPMIAIWDDHEFADNAWKGGAINHNMATQGDWLVRVANALQAYYEWIPTRPPDPSNLKKNYRRFQVGKLLDLFMLEERVGARDMQVVVGSGDSADFGAFMASQVADASRQMLGATEEQWLFSGLQGSGATWKFLGQGVMFGQLKAAGAPNATGASTYLNTDQWDGYDPARQRILSTLAGDSTKPATNPKVNNTVVLTGDIHSAWAMDLTPDPNNPAAYNPATGSGSLAVEFVCTSVTSPFADAMGLGQGSNVQPANPHIKYFDLTRHGYLMLDITPKQVQGEFWVVSTITTQGGTQSFTTGYTVADGANHLGLVPVTAASADAPNPPAFAP